MKRIYLILILLAAAFLFMACSLFGTSNDSMRSLATSPTKEVLTGAANSPTPEATATPEPTIDPYLERLYEEAERIENLEGNYSVLSPFVSKPTMAGKNVYLEDESEDFFIAIIVEEDLGENSTEVDLMEQAEVMLGSGVEDYVNFGNRYTKTYGDFTYLTENYLLQIFDQRLVGEIAVTTSDNTLAFITFAWDDSHKGYLNWYDSGSMIYHRVLSSIELLSE